METAVRAAPQTKSRQPQKIVYASQKHTHQTVWIATTTVKSAQTLQSSVQNATAQQCDTWTSIANHAYATTGISMMEVLKCVQDVINLARHAAVLRVA
jgi:hypothetical protein